MNALHEHVFAINYKKCIYFVIILKLTEEWSRQTFWKDNIYESQSILAYSKCGSFWQKMFVVVVEIFFAETLKTISCFQRDIESVWGIALCVLIFSIFWVFIILYRIYNWVLISLLIDCETETGHCKISVEH